MKKILALTLALSLLLCGCGGQASAAKETTAAAPAVTEAPTTVATEPATTAPTEPPVVYRNPINGEVIDEPYTGRLFAVTVSNLQENMPHVGLTEADMVMEMYVNRANVIRCLAIYSDIRDIPAIGSTRSTRPIFNDIAHHYSIIVAHAGGSNQSLADAAYHGIENFNIDSWEVQKTGASYRDTEHKRSYENTLYGIGTGIYNYAESKGYPMTLEKDYGLVFADEGVINGSETANTVSVEFIYEKAKKTTNMVYDETLGQYVWNQYGQEMTDLITGEKETFTNVLIQFTQMAHDGIYHVADFNAGGNGYYANGGKIMPMVWYCENDEDVFHYQDLDGNPIVLGQGKTYVAVASPDSIVTFS